MLRGLGRSSAAGSSALRLAAAVCLAVACGGNSARQIIPPPYSSGGSAAMGSGASGASAGKAGSANGSAGRGGSTNGGSNAGGAGNGVEAGRAGGAALGGSAGAGTSGTAGTGSPPYDSSAPPALRGAPVLFAPTAEGFGLSAVLSAGDPALLRLSVRPSGTTKWSAASTPTVRAMDLAEWSVSGLAAGSSYEYSVSVNADAGGTGGASGAAGASGAGAEGDTTPLYQGSVVTARDAGNAFSFALVTDTHIGADLSYSNQGDEGLLTQAAGEIAAFSPDFVVNLGDMLDFHEYGFNTPPPDSSISRAAYLNYRTGFGDLLAHSPHFGVIGGWDSESGCNTIEEIERSRTQRLLYLPGPEPTTYPQGGSPFEDYYAFTWGDALFVVLNVFTYTPTCHLLSSLPGAPDDWTLGDAQMAFLRSTLEQSTSKWRFLLIHHPVGGNGGDDANSGYGRGGGRAAYVGEQAVVHQLMLDYGVQVFFYGHDHVFVDMPVDNVHYSLPGSAGAIWMFTEAETGYTDFWPDPGYAKVDVTPASVHVQFLELGGQLLYEYTLQSP